MSLIGLRPHSGIQADSRPAGLGGVTAHPNQPWWRRVRQRSALRCWSTRDRLPHERYRAFGGQSALSYLTQARCRGPGRNRIRLPISPEVSLFAIGSSYRDLHAVLPTKLEEQHLTMTEIIPIHPFDDGGGDRLAALSARWTCDRERGRTHPPMALEPDAGRSLVEGLAKGRPHPP